MKRIPVKWLRDFNKSEYPKKKECAICGSTEKLELHHLYSIALLFEKWCSINKYKIETDEDIIEHREEFTEQHTKEIFKDVVTLCKEHHSRLHKLYGLTPVLGTAEKQRRWIAIQAKKLGRAYDPEVLD